MTVNSHGQHLIAKMSNEKNDSQSVFLHGQMDQGLGVVVNDVAAVNIDAQLIQRQVWLELLDTDTVFVWRGMNAVVQSKLRSLQMAVSEP